MGLGFEGMKGDKGQKGEIGVPGESHPYPFRSGLNEVIGPIGQPGQKGEKVSFFYVY